MKSIFFLLVSLMISGAAFASTCNQRFEKFLGVYELDSEVSTPQLCATKLVIKENQILPCERLDIESYVGTGLVETETLYFQKYIEKTNDSTGEKIRIRTKFAVNNDYGISTVYQKQVFPGGFINYAIKNIWSTTGAHNLMVESNEEDKIIKKCFYKNSTLD